MKRTVAVKPWTAQPLESFVSEAGVRLALLMTPAGQVFAQHGFTRAVDVDHILLAKLDGTAKGGVVLGIAQEVGVPVRYVGVGEGLYDLREFEPEPFVQALFAHDEQGDEQEAASVG